MRFTVTVNGQPTISSLAGRDHDAAMMLGYAVATGRTRVPTDGMGGVAIDITGWRRPECTTCVRTADEHRDTYRDVTGRRIDVVRV